MALFSLDDKDLTSLRRSVFIYAGLFYLLERHCSDIRIPFLTSGPNDAPLNIQSNDFKWVFLAIFSYLLFKIILFWVEARPQEKKRSRDERNTPKADLPVLDRHLEHFFQELENHEALQKADEIQDFVSAPLNELEKNERQIKRIAEELVQVAERLEAELDEGKTGALQKLRIQNTDLEDNISNLGGIKRNLEAGKQYATTIKELQNLANSGKKAMETVLKVDRAYRERNSFLEKCYAAARFIRTSFLDVGLPGGIASLAIAYILLSPIPSLSPECAHSSVSIGSPAKSHTLQTLPQQVEP